MAGGSDGYISDGSGDFAVTEALAKEESDAISMNEESLSNDDVTPLATPVKKASTDLPQAEAVSDNEDDAEPVAKKAKTEPSEPREDLEDGEIETDSDEEQPEPPQNPAPRSLRSISPPIITGPIPLNRLSTTRPPRVDFPRNSTSSGSNGSRRRRPEDYGICKFYLRDNCTWGDRCKYGHPVGKERVEWLKDLGLPDLSVSNTSNASSRPSRRRSNSPRGERTSRDRKTSHVNGKRPERQPSPISSEGSRSPSPARPLKRKRTPPKSVAVSSDEEDERPKKSESPRRHRRRSDRDRSRSSSRDSKSRSPPHKRFSSSIRELLRKHRFETEQRTSSPAVESVSSDEDESNVSKPAIKKASPANEAPASPELQAVSSDEENVAGDEPMFRDRSVTPPLASV